MFDGCLPFGGKMQIKLVSAHMKADMNAKIHNNMRENARMREKMRNFEKMKKCKSGVNFHQSGVNFRMLGPPKKIAVFSHFVSHFLAQILCMIELCKLV